MSIAECIWFSRLHFLLKSVIQMPKIYGQLKIIMRYWIMLNEDPWLEISAESLNFKGSYFHTWIERMLRDERNKEIFLILFFSLFYYYSNAVRQVVPFEKRKQRAPFAKTEEKVANTHQCAESSWIFLSLGKEGEQTWKNQDEKKLNK